VVNLLHYYLPGELEREIGRYVEYYNNHRYHESLENLTPADVYFGRKREQLTMRERIKRENYENEANLQLEQRRNQKPAASYKKYTLVIK